MTKNPQLPSDDNEGPVRLSRRKFLKGASYAAPVILSVVVASSPVLGFGGGSGGGGGGGPDRNEDGFDQSSLDPEDYPSEEVGIYSQFPKPE